MHIARALHEGVSNRGNHAKWVQTCRIQKCIDRGIQAHRAAVKADAHARFLQSLHRGPGGSVPQQNKGPNLGTPMEAALRVGVQIAAAAKEERDMQKAIAASLVAKPPGSPRAEPLTEEKSPS